MLMIILILAHIMFVNILNLFTYGIAEQLNTSCSPCLSSCWWTWNINFSYNTTTCSVQGKDINSII